jgi:hypothetical protein
VCVPGSAVLGGFSRGCASGIVVLVLVPMYASYRMMWPGGWGASRCHASVAGFRMSFLLKSVGPVDVFLGSLLGPLLLPGPHLLRASLSQWVVPSLPSLSIRNDDVSPVDTLVLCCALARAVSIYSGMVYRSVHACLCSSLEVVVFPLWLPVRRGLLPGLTRGFHLKRSPTGEDCECRGPAGGTWLVSSQRSFECVPEYAFGAWCVLGVGTRGLAVNAYRYQG